MQVDDTVMRIARIGRYIDGVLYFEIGGWIDKRSIIPDCMKGFRIIIESLVIVAADGIVSDT